MPIRIAALVLPLLLGTLASPALAFGPLGNAAISEHLPADWRELVLQHRAAFDSGANFPSLGQADMPDMLLRLYQGLRPPGAPVDPGIALDTLPLALDLVAQAQTAEEAAFGVGAVTHLAGRIVLHTFYVPHLIDANGDTTTTASVATQLAIGMVELRLADTWRDRVCRSLRQRSVDCLLHFLRVAQAHGSPLDAATFMHGVARHETSLEMRIDATGPGGALAAGMAQVRLFLPGSAALLDPATYRGADRFLQLAGTATASLLTHGAASPWAQHCLASMRPAISASLQIPLRDQQRRRLPRGASSPNPGLAVLDMWIEDDRGRRVDTAPPGACEPRGPRGGAHLFAACLHVAAWQPVTATSVRLEVLADRWQGEPRVMATVEVPLAFTAADVAAGVVRELRVQFRFGPDDGPYEVAWLEPYTRGFVLTAAVRTSRGRWLDWFSSRATALQELAGWSSYDTWPHSLTVSPDARRVSRQPGNRHESRLIDAVPSGYTHRLPWALLAAEPTNARLQAADGRLLDGTVWRAVGSPLGAVLLHDWRNGRTAWSPLQPLLRDAGITTLAIDFRGRGNSGTVDDRRAWARRDAGLAAAMIADVRVAVAWLRANGVGRIALVGAEAPATQAILAALPELDPAAIVLLSPAAPIGTATRALAGRPVFVTLAADDADQTATADRLVAAAGDGAHAWRIAGSPLRATGLRQLRLTPGAPERVRDFLADALPG